MKPSSKNVAKAIVNAEMIQKSEFKRRRRKHTHYILCFLFPGTRCGPTSIRLARSCYILYIVCWNLLLRGYNVRQRNFVFNCFPSQALPIVPNGSLAFNTAVSSRAYTTAPRAQGSGGCAGLYIMYIYTYLYILIHRYSNIYIYRSIACFLHVDGTLQNPTQQTSAVRLTSEINNI